MKIKFSQESQAETFRRLYAEVKLDVVIAVAPQALLFAVKYRDRIFPDVPIVFTQVGTREFLGRTWPRVTGLTVPVGIGETIDLALQLNPDTKAVAVLGGVDWYWLAVVHSELLRYQGKVREIVFNDPASRALLEKVLALPPQTVVLFHITPSNASQPEFGGWQLLAAVTQRWPTYSAWPVCLDHGCVGGAYPDLAKEHLSTAVIAARVLSGERPEDIPIAHDTYLQDRVDWRELRHWNIPESALPSGSVILYRPPSLWESYRRYLIAMIMVIGALLLLVIGLLWERARKRKVESQLRESEKRFRVMTDTTPSLVWMCDPQGKVTYLNQRRIEFTGSNSNAGYSDSWATYVHPDDLKNLKDGMSQGLKNQQAFSREYRLRRSDGVYRWMFDVASPRENGDGSFGGFIGSAVDVTDQKHAQQALEKISGQLIEAQEKERARIARDLHDDICQRLAVLSMEIEQANRSVSESSEGTKKSLEEIGQHCSEIAVDLQSLSHQLHSSMLDCLGIVAAIQGFCQELSKQHELDIEFRDSDVPRDLPKDISLCLFRIVQEALHNAMKYSETDQFSVALCATAEEVQLVVRDTGAGFDVEEAKKNRGLGLVSMQERVNLVHGRFSVESKPGQGTRIFAAVPFVAENENTPQASQGKEPAVVHQVT
ncbi:PAS domain S-box protein [Acidobacterium sp. S8]|uniref:sensor histidine kinase n=1 Tax=Acidobacterium sp. S8 TaxID=1641854 RepID=UPI0020B122D1|nr:PAS domain S-box protein [Acidobacterium sp. S8]